MTTAYEDFHAADKAWSAELVRLFGRDAGDVRYTAEGKGQPGSVLRQLHDAVAAARVAWERERGIYAEPIHFLPGAAGNPIRLDGLRPVSDPSVFSLAEHAGTAGKPQKSAAKQVNSLQHSLKEC